jgi:16S rRNA (cytosine967-C5)-methyltransferase
MNQARTIAVNLLSQAQDNRIALDQLLNRAEKQIRQLNRPDRSLVHVLVYGVLRWQSRLDWVIDHLAARNSKMDLMVRTILRMGLFQIQFLNRIPVSAAVNTSVELAKKNGRAWASGFINGVLRKVIREPGQIAWPDPIRSPVAFLSTTQAFPNWMISRWLERWGQEATEALCRTINTIPAITLRTNTLRISREQLIEDIRAEAETIQEAVYSPEGFSLTHLNRPLPQWPAFQKGWFQVQSEAAQLTSHFLAPRPGERIWDVCAGLGTKTAHMAQLMENQGQIMATDLYADKLKQLDLDMDRLGITIVQSAQLDLTALEPGFQPEKFDRIMLDAPCSGLGVLQKNPDGKWRVSPSDINKNSLRQLVLLDKAAPFLKTGGILVYAVCSLEPEENEVVIEGFLQKHPEFDIYHANLETSAKADTLLTPQGFLTTIPHLHQLNGFFAAALIKKSDYSPKNH